MFIAEISHNTTRAITSWFSFLNGWTCFPGKLVAKCVFQTRIGLKDTQEVKLPTTQMRPWTKSQCM